MKISKTKKLSFILVVLLSIGLVFGLTSLYSMDPGTKPLDNFKPIKPKVSLIPEDVKISTDFIGGLEKRVGRVQKVQGKVYVIHKGDKTAYQLKSRHPIFEGDTIITSSRSRINAAMKDRSVLAMAPNAKLVVSKLEYEPKIKTRSTKMGLLWGNVRFIVEKLSGKLDYQVHTETAVCGIRGTDFAVSVAPAPEGKQGSLGHKILAWLNPVREAHAQIIGIPVITTVLTGAGSVGLTGTVGGTTIIGSGFVAGALGGTAAGTATFVGVSTAGGVLGTIGPGLATLGMPPEFD